MRMETARNPAATVATDEKAATPAANQDWFRGL
jgi:hypothetical protein